MSWIARRKDWIAIFKPRSQDGFDFLEMVEYPIPSELMNQPNPIWRYNMTGSKKVVRFVLTCCQDGHGHGDSILCNSLHPLASEPLRFELSDLINWYIATRQSAIRKNRAAMLRSMSHDSNPQKRQMAPYFLGYWSCSFQTLYPW